MNLNPEQQEAVAHYLGPCLVTAVPGSGKTRVLTSRVISLVDNKNVDPRNILCLTFTNKAANEMKERISKALGAKASNVWISTFHKLCLAVLRKHGKIVNIQPNFSIYSSKEQDELMTKLARMHDNDSDRKAVFRLSKAVNDYREDTVEVEKHLGELNNIEASIVKEYLTTLDEANAVDFSGMLYKTLQILIKSPEVAESLVKRFKFVLVDEFQDTNSIQYDIVKRISIHTNIFVVGDYNQAIYGFRGAKPENMKHFLNDFIGTKVVVLPRNYRSLDPILRVAENLIRNNKDAKDVLLKADREGDCTVDINGFLDEEEEAENLANRIEYLKHHQGYKWKDFAVLYRVNSLSRSPEMALRNRGIPYSIVGGFSFFDRSEIKTTLSYLSLLINHHDTINFARAISYPKRGIGPEAIGKLEVMCSQNKNSIIDMCNNISSMPFSMKIKSGLSTFGHIIEKYSKEHSNGGSLSDIASRMLKEVGYMDYLKTIDQDEAADKSRLENVEEMMIGIAEYEEQKPNSRFTDYLHTVHLAASDFQDENGIEDDTVKLCTIHSAKGLEWPCVDIIGVERGCLPHIKSEDENRIEEERRLLFVGITRARSFLSLSYCKTRRRRMAGRSMFLDEI